ncbi:hypothetical protein [Flavobacterium tegetincola]|uniref:hypothetical protein n=1 Tax=Flavobacterium tegetincola TaxID=150172 RepID=UPI00041E5C27|nr:hypothetical protein [Flavobacterium tegetincola]
MKNTFLRTLFLLSFLLIDLVLFAQPYGSGPGTDDENGTLEGDDLPAASINAKLIWLAVVGIIFAYYTFQKSRLAKLSK